MNIVPREILPGILFLIILLYDNVKIAHYLWFSEISFILTAILTRYTWNHQDIPGTIRIYLEPSGYTWNHRDIPGTKAFLLTLLYIIGMIIVQAGELLSTSLRGMTAYANLYYRFIQYAPVCCLLLCLQSTGKFRLRIRKSLQLYPQFCLISSTQKYRTDIRLRWRTRQPAE